MNVKILSIVTTLSLLFTMCPTTRTTENYLEKYKEKCLNILKSKTVLKVAGGVAAGVVGTGVLAYTFFKLFNQQKSKRSLLEKFREKSLKQFSEDYYFDEDETICFSEKEYEEVKSLAEKVCEQINESDVKKWSVDSDPSKDYLTDVAQNTNYFKYWNNVLKIYNNLLKDDKEFLKTHNKLIKVDKKDELNYRKNALENLVIMKTIDMLEENEWLIVSDKRNKGFYQMDKILVIENEEVKNGRKNVKCFFCDTTWDYALKLKVRRKNFEEKVIRKFKEKYPDNKLNCDFQEYYKELSSCYEEVYKNDRSFDFSSNDKMAEDLYKKISKCVVMTHITEKILAKHLGALWRVFGVSDNYFEINEILSCRNSKETFNK